MSKRIYLAADRGDLGGTTNLELPLHGPGAANLLVCVNGYTLSGFDTDEDFNTEDRTTIQFLIDTGYQLRDDDVLVNSSSYTTLASIGMDDERGLLLSLENNSVVVRGSKEIQLEINGETAGDNAIYRIGYQMNLLLIRRR